MSKKKKDYLGQAGIFSTDNQVSDQMQIDAESHDPDEYEDKHEPE
jgi:hypothetical protein